MRFPGAQYADIDASGVPHIAPPDFPTDGLCRQMRCSRSGKFFAGIGQGDVVYEWMDGTWHFAGRSWGPRAVIYREEQLLIIRPPGPANGYRYIAPDGTPVFAVPDTYAHPTLPIWEYTVLPNGWLVGQGGAGQHGEDPLVIIDPSDGIRRLVQTGMCRFINAYLVGERIDLAWQQDGIGSDARSLTLAEVANLPNADAGAPVPQPTPIPTPQEPIVIPDYGPRFVAFWTALDMSARQIPAYGLPPILDPDAREAFGQTDEYRLARGRVLHLQAHCVQLFAKQVLKPELARLHIEVAHEWHYNAIPGTSIFVNPDILLLTTQDGTVHSMKLVGSDHALDREHGAPRWTFGVPVWSLQGAPNPEHRRPLESIDLGPSPFDTAPIPQPQPQPTPDPTQPHPEIAVLRAELAQVRRELLDKIAAIPQPSPTPELDYGAIASEMVRRLKAEGPVTIGWWTKTVSLPVVKK